MTDKTPSRFAPQGQTTQERLSSNTVGLVQLSDFRKRRAEVLEQQEREAHEGSATTDRSQTATPYASDSGEGGSKLPKKKKKKVASKLSFGDDEDEDADAAGPTLNKKKDGDKNGAAEKKKITANTSVGIVPKATTKAALQREALERERLRKEFLIIQEAVRATEIAIPFVFYDGTDIPGGIVRVKKGDFIWVSLDKSRKIGADLGVSEKTNARREWARVGVDDLMLVRGSVIIPHHFDFYFFIMNKSTGPGGQILFDYSAEAPDPKDRPDPEDTAPAAPKGGLTTAAALKQAAIRALPDISTLEGAGDDPTFTKVVDRRWFERNKHIYPASTWQEFDPERDYQTDVRKDGGGNTFFFSK
ncbi:XAP5, circadian clock regulator-domain-containing protein [Plectosphaerella cucumerina]|uniref:XAP5, circadian clock regulator-domain-containing protein n=1 Tax=Plectosphaerella cucumerina TaxID=40658 RepID=A0A8K0XAM5_9PEZI|nr:XAP5, circadian clock regulator-domain-containing protein [Plectosphaerella cucumerina]